MYITKHNSSHNNITRLQISLDTSQDALNLSH